jgi:hypothetical protein
MNVSRGLALTLLSALTMGAAAAAPTTAPPPKITTPPREARQFDFLIGQWKLVVEPQVSSLVAFIHGAPQLPGTWKAWRGPDGFGIEDELRITDAEGNPQALTYTLRAYNPTAHQWNQQSLDAYRTRFQGGTGEWRNGAMTVVSPGFDGDGHPLVARSRFYDIAATAFRWQQDVSYDGGRTWTEGKLKITAQRVAATAAR